MSDYPIDPSDPVFVDTNVLVYALDEGEEEKQALAQHILRIHSLQLVISTQVMLEFFAVCTSKLGVEPHKASAALNSLAHLALVPADRTLILESASLAERYQLSVFDAAIIAAALRGECAAILTEDLSHGQRFADLTVVNPFASLAEPPPPAA